LAYDAATLATLSTKPAPEEEEEEEEEDTVGGPMPPPVGEASLDAWWNCISAGEAQMESSIVLLVEEVRWNVANYTKLSTQGRQFICIDSAYAGRRGM